MFPSRPQRAAGGGNGVLVVEGSASAVQTVHVPELLPQRVPRPAHRSGTTSGSRHCTDQGKSSVQ